MLPGLFLLSGIMRAIAAGIFLRRFKEVRLVEPIRHRDLIYRVSHIRPVAGATFSLITGPFREQPEIRNRDPRDKNRPGGSNLES